MRVVVRLALVLITLLVVSNVAFAATCTGDQVVCYDATQTYTSGTSTDWIYKFCLNNDGTGVMCLIGLQTICFDNLKVFGGGAGWFNFNGNPQFGGKPNWSTWIVNGTGFSGYYQPLGAGGVLLTGVETGNGSGTQRWIVNGSKVPCPM
jgi:hypothetical protein